MTEQEDATRNKDHRQPQEPSTQSAPAPNVAAPADAQRFAQPTQPAEPDDAEGES